MSAPFTDLRLMGWSPPSAANPLLLGLSGRMRSGKTSLAQYVTRKYGGVVTSFAQTLKVEVYDALAQTSGPNAFYKWCQEAKGAPPVPSALAMDPRSLNTAASVAQKIATVDENKSDLRSMLEYWGDWRREYDANYFIDSTVRRIEKLRESHDVIVVDDVRTRSEILALEALGFSVVRIQACDGCRAERGGASTNHKIETELDSHCHEHTLHNDNEPWQAEADLEHIITKILTH